MKDWDDEFDNVGHVPNALGFFDIWCGRAAAFRNTHTKAEINQPYGDMERQKFDMFWPEGTPKGLVVFIHGGYWKRLDRSYFSDLAAGPLAHGWAVAMPSYTLAPNAYIHEMTFEIAHAVTAAAKRIEGPIRLIGHSAGGHLATRMMCKDTSLDASIISRIENVVSVSGVHDLRNLCHTELNEVLRLSTEEAISESPYLQTPLSNIPLNCWVGADERPEFISQTKILHEKWSELGVDTKLMIEPTMHHFTVVDGLKDMNSEMVKALLG
ncbi:alpha/beta hydrolase [Amylibacter sp. SFDW26]|uniref:alpha/beta hydrolase n=1 Tax=Amylibacter sp. SFDW26 TaxID=2652722 RepID=UPI0012620BEB|nr:alpha/beta hydrolase [Amylibacter sp. SFDW26]KAB7613341.1 alpha/beta hydrolase [Amylibacter sp. SFDW26]